MQISSNVSDVVSVDANTRESSTRTNKEVRILNWNIEGLIGKLGDSDFMQYVSSFDIICFTETFLEFRSPLDCFPGYVQFFSPAIKISQHSRGSGGVMVMVKSALEKKTFVLDQSQDNMIWLKFDKTVFSSDRDVVFCALYVCPYDSPYYRQEHVNVTSTLSVVEQCLLDYVEQYDDTYYYLLCGDFNARTSSFNVSDYDIEDNDNIQSVVQSDIFSARHSEDSVLNAFGRLLLELCATCRLSILNGTCRGDEKGSYTYVCSSGCSTIDYFVSSKELISEVDLSVEERFESKHLPVVLTLYRSPSGGSVHLTKSIEKVMWDEMKVPLFEEALKGIQFESSIAEATVLLYESVDSAVDCFTSGLIQAADCMKRRIYIGPKQSKWFDMECKAAKRNTRKWWRLFRRAKCEQSKNAHRLQYVECRKVYRFTLKTKRVIYKQVKLESLVAKVKDSKMFWSELKSVCQKSQKQPNISSDQWFSHFRSVFNATEEHVVPPSDIAEHPEPHSVECLDQPISAQEVLSAINHLNLNKSAGPDCILAGMLKFSVSRTLPFVVELFNRIFDSGEYPSAWTEAIVVPIHKSGDFDNPDNYRGISLLSILGKVFSHVLNRRLTLWAEDNNKISEVQGGFRAGYSTIDNIYVLFTVVQKYLLKKSGKVYICFVDFKKAFDCVNRAILWNTLRKAGIGGKMLHILTNIYKSVRSCVRCPESITECFDCPNGVRQGCVLSPTLFSFLINELALEVAEKGMHGVQLSPDIIQILIILFADDVALASYTTVGLQRQINILKEYADNFGMQVNLSKTKVIVFRKGGYLSQKEHWKYGNELLEVVNSYKYLGLHFTTKLSLTKAVSELAVKAKIRTSQVLRCLFRLGDVPRHVFFKIFDAQIMPVLLYGAEVWGYQQFGDLEKVHLFACKRLLRVGSQTPNKMIYGDLGRYPVFITSAIRFVKYWLRLISMPEERLPRKAYLMSRSMIDTGKKTWAFHLKSLLCEHGLGEAWQQQGVGSVGSFLTTLRQRLLDRFQQDWNQSVQSKERFEFYAQFKRVLKAEHYVDVNQLRCFKIAYVQFRLGISPINKHRLRYRLGVTPQQLLCPVCKAATEDEAHILFNCNAYADLRNDSYLFANNGTVINTISALMSAEDDQSVCELSRFLYKVFKVRSNFVKTV